ncbi:MAG: hypothetical protein IJV76_12645 [Clostridia bacterium]|nr:hypothetical protein [Clostridia bacterium]
MKKFITLALALCMALSASVCAYAAESDTDGGSGSTPVYLSSTDDGTMNGEPSATAMSVTVPTALPMAMSQTGDVTTADNCQIVNHSYGAVRVKSVTISAENGWRLTAFGDKSTLASEKVDSDQLGFALRIGGGEWAVTDSSDESAQALISAPIAGCYMSGAGNAANNSVSVDYSAIVTPLSTPVTNANIANVVFVIEWDTAA